MKQVQQRELEPNEILQESINKYKIDSFYVAYSGGKDSGIALNYVANNFSKQFRGVIFVNTGIGTEATIDFVKSYCKAKKYPLFILKPENVIRKDGTPYSYENLVMRWGFPTFSGHRITMQQLKFFPIRQFIQQKMKEGKKPCIISGIRKKESARRKNNKKWNTSIDNDLGNKIIFVKPLYYKSNNWVMKYFIENDIKRSPVYDTLHISGDCLCGCFAQKDEAKLLQMFHPDVYQKIINLEKKFNSIPNHKYKKYSKWGNTNMKSITEVEAQTNIESFICSDCILDRSSTDEDTKRFNDEFEDIEAKLEMV